MIWGVVKVMRAFIVAVASVVTTLQTPARITPATKLWQPLLAVPLAAVARTVIVPLHIGSIAPNEMPCVQLTVGAALTIFEGMAKTAIEDTHAKSRQEDFIRLHL